MMIDHRCVRVALRSAMPAAAITLAFAPMLVLAQAETSDNDPAATGSDPGTKLETVSVFSERIYRNRTDDTNPVLSYGQEFFQRYEPESVGDMLKRVPGVAFTSDVGEFDAPQLRGLPSGFTQVLINGERIPGAGPDRSIFVDRIPAELVERIEIVRSPSAKIDSQGIGGTINIILKDSMNFQGLFASAGGSYFEADSMRNLDDKVRGRGSLTWGDQVGDLSFLVSGSFTERRTPKNKETSVFEGDELAEFVAERDVRESDDIALNWDFDLRAGGRGRFMLDGFFINTDRTEEEFVELFEPEVSDIARFRDETINVDVSGFEALERETQLEDIEQNQYEIDIGTEWLLTEQMEFAAGAAFGKFDNEIDVEESAFDLEDDEREDALEDIDTEDEELEFNLDFTWRPAGQQQLDFGGAVRLRDRDDSNREFEREGDDPFEEETPNSGVFAIEEDVFAGYVSHNWTPSALPGLTMEHGVRVEFTDLESRNPAAEQPDAGDDYTDVNPTIHYRYDLTEVDRFHASIARTVRRPGFDQLTPFVDEEEPSDDEATQGNPMLEPETAWGVDIGYERQFAAGRGIAGINLFYRDIEDLIELSDTGQTFGGEFDLFRFENVGSGEVYGLELDLSSSLEAIGLPDTSIFGNFALIESEVRDPFTGQNRDFNLVPELIFNAGFNHSFAGTGFSLGMSFQGVGESTEVQADEIEELDRDVFLEAFLEQRFSDRWIVRLTGSNLLDQTKVERKTGFDSLGDLIAGNVEAREIELEETGPWVRFVIRAAF